MVRLKYYKLGNNLYTDWFTVGPNFIVRGCISLDNYNVSINEFNSSIIVSANSDNLRKSKYLVKKKLSEVGVIFDGEIRRVK